MTLYTPAYRATIYELDGATPLTPRVGSGHAEAFKVATAAGIVGFRPYLNFPRGRRSRLDMLSRQTDIGSLTLDVMDARLVSGGSNFERWVTAFVGDDAGRIQLLGKPVFIEESLNGSTWSPYLSGVVQDAGLVSGSRVMMQFAVRENGETMKAKCFVGRPHPSITYAESSSLLPLGPALPYGGYPAAPPIPATVKQIAVGSWGTGNIVVVRRAAIVTGNLYTMLTTLHEPLKSMLRKEAGRWRGETSTNRKPLTGVQVDLFGAGGGAYIGSYEVVRSPMAYADIEEGIEDTEIIVWVGIQPLDPSDVRYALMPAHGTDVEFRVMLSGKPTSDAPIYVSDVHPAQLAKDVLAGKFGRFSAVDGSPLRIMPAEASSFTARIADASIPAARFRIEDQFSVNEFIEQQICLPFGMAYRFNGSGQAELVDVRMPTSSAGVVTITNADLAADAPGWSVNMEDAIAEVLIGYYVDVQDDPNLFASGMSIGASQPTWLNSYGGVNDNVYEHLLLLESPGFGRANPMTIDALGLRYSSDVTDRLPEGSDLVPLILTPKVKVGRYVHALIEQLRSLLSGGLASTVLTCRRTANTDTCLPGDLRILDVEEVPNAAGNVRGGARVARCVERMEEGPTLLLSFVDMGADAVAVSPTIGSPALVSGRGMDAVQAVVTLNAQGEPAVVWVAPTATSVGTSPAHDGGQWVFGARVTSGGTVVVSGLPSGSRIWVRARSEPSGAMSLKLPSPWVTPAGTKFITTTGLPAPLDLSVLYQNGSEVGVAFTPGDPALPVETFVDGELEDTLPPGSSLAVFRAVPAGSHALGLRHIDGAGGFSTLSTVNVTVSGGLEKCPTMIGIGLAVGEAG